MSENDSTDPYRTPDQSGGDPYRTPPQAPGQQYPSQQYPPQQYPGGGVDPERGSQPATVARLRQVMLAGAVAAVLQGVYAVFALDDVLADSSGDLEQIAADSGMDANGLMDMAGDVALGFVLVGTVLTAGLWLLFARLFDRGSGRIVGTVLAGFNALFLVVGLLAPTDVIEWVLTAISSALVVTGLVLLWRPVTSAWFRAVAAAKAQRTWG